MKLKNVNIPKPLKIALIVIAIIIVVLFFCTVALVLFFRFYFGLQVKFKKTFPFYYTIKKENYTYLEAKQTAGELIWPPVSISVVYFYSKNCGYCNKFTNEVWNDMSKRTIIVDNNTKLEYYPYESKMVDLYNGAKKNGEDIEKRFTFVNKENIYFNEMDFVGIDVAELSEELITRYKISAFPTVLMFFTYSLEEIPITKEVITNGKYADGKYFTFTDFMPVQRLLGYVNKKEFELFLNSMPKIRRFALVVSDYDKYHFTDLWIDIMSNPKTSKNIGFLEITKKDMMDHFGDENKVLQKYKELKINTGDSYMFIFDNYQVDTGGVLSMDEIILEKEPLKNISISKWKFLEEAKLSDDSFKITYKVPYKGSEKPFGTTDEISYKLRKRVKLPVTIGQDDMKELIMS